MASRKIFFLLIFISLQAWGSTENEKKEIEKIVTSSKVDKDDLGLYISSLEGDQDVVIFENNSTKKFIPASISKIVTASTALDYFQPGYKFKTQLLIDASSQLDKSTLKGPLYLRGGGDPSFVSENMWFLVNAFLRKGIHKIEGPIIVDDTLFDTIRFDSSRQEQRVDRAYDAPVGAMSFNWNSVNIFVRPTSPGQPAKVFLDPENSYLELVNRTNTVKGEQNKLQAERVKNKIIVSGSLGEGLKEVVIYKSIQEPDLWSGENLKSFLKQRQIEVTGEVKSGKAPSTAEIVAESESKSIEEILADMNKFSNNYVAEMIVKNIASIDSAPGSLEKGVKKMNEHLKKIGLSAEEYEVYNPSGLTRDNKMSAKGMWKILNHLKNDFRVFPEFISSLPISGVDGTLKKRMKGTPAERWVRAKTGFLTNVVTLAGYAGRPDGRVFTFVFIYNGPVDESKIRNFFDQLLVTLVK